MPEMNNEEFRKIWKWLDALCKENLSGTGLSSFNEAGMIGVIEHVEQDLKKFRAELIARAKAQYENHKTNEQCLIDAVGHTTYSQIEPNYMNGLNFGD